MKVTQEKRSYGTVCCVPGCKNSTKFNRNVSWHGFPKDARTRREWIKRVHRVGSSGKFSKWSPSASHRICGAHFNESGKKKYEEKLPTIFPNKIYATKYFEICQSTSSVITQDTFNRIIYPMQFDETSPRFVPELTTEIDIGASVVVNHVQNYIKYPHPSTSSSPGTATDPAHFVEPDLVNEASHAWSHITCHNYTLPVSETLGSMRKTLDNVISANLALEAENVSLKTKVKTLMEQLSNVQQKCKKLETDLTIHKSIPPLEKNKFSLESVIADDAKIKFYTGFDGKVRLEIFLNFIKAAYNGTMKKKDSSMGRPKILLLDDEVFLVLCRLRLGLLEADLAHRFDVSVATISRIWNFWIPFICSCLVQVPVWPSRQTVDLFMPKEFKEIYPSTRVILDCTEIFIENPTEFRVQSDTYSSYKSHNTAKGLIGITPNGFVSLVSDLAPGRVSDKVITNESGLYEMLQPGDSVMADRGFLIEEQLQQVGVGLNIPPFLRGKPQLSNKDEKLTRDIAKLRIHVERVIRGVKQFRILKYVFPNSMADKLDFIWKICCLLTNFTSEPLLDR